MLPEIDWTGFNRSFVNSRKWSWKWATQNGLPYYHLEENHSFFDLVPVWAKVAAAPFFPVEANVLGLFVQVQWSTTENPDIAHTTNYKIRISSSFFRQNPNPSVIVSLVNSEVRGFQPPKLVASLPDFLLSPITEAAWNELQVQR